ncbi:pyridoxal 4-dehydrogenase [Dictyobacter alpinus]|uniref:Pyridoxal 4-dehydrogenase n=1 Tax=Dictyobacter alpinus TaxID=2014873 RepID=A0A402BI71_9CHLR|nr:aldo/keto reductase [Dictyobacter alpinus]GCE30947.1 pyridoxal 4-dehydrogenase [Dictyobacter alpinus]
MTNFQPTSSLPVHRLGKTDLEVVNLCVGCAPLGDMPDTFAYSVPEEQALETIRTIFRSPITFVDTAASYGDGESERRIGVVLKELGGVPAGYTLATKADRDLKTNEFSGDQMRRSVERSLKLLGLSKLPLLYLHDPEHITFEQAMAPGGPVEVLQQCKQEGLVEHLGVAGGPIDLMTRFVETDIFEAAISHNRYTLLNTEADPFWDVCQRHGVGAVNAAPYGSGILAKGPRAYPRYQYSEAPKAYLDKALKLEEAAQKYNIPLAAVALQFSLRDPRIHSTIVGMTRPERLDETVKLAQISIPTELWTEIDTIRRG